MAAMDVARSLSLQPAATQDSLRQKAASPEPHYRLSRLNPPVSLRPPSVISRSVSAGMTFSFKKEKDKDREKDGRRHPEAPSPDERPHSRFAFTLRKKVSLASLLSSTPSPEESASSSRTSSTSSAHGPTIVPPIEALAPPSPSAQYDSDESDADEDVHAPDRFVKKNAWRSRHKMRLHPYPDVPYMQAYDPVVLENERYTHYLQRRLAPIDSPTFHNYHNSPPASVLDLGCGAGLWLLDAARMWRTTQFVGLDLVDVALPAFADGAVPNVRLVRGDFLKYALPFPDRQFELVRMANLSLCIPFQKWEYVLREAARVLAPGGRLELVDDQTFFPYGDAPVEEAIGAEADSEADNDLLSPTPTVQPAVPSPAIRDALSPNTPTPRVPPSTPDTSAFFDSDDEEEDDDVPQTSSDSDELQPTTPDSASEHSSSFTDAASTLVGSERGSVELKKLSMSSVTPPATGL
ncbi:Methyltransf-25 domain-containing protein [Mycena sanguinolenta]|uniref:Methyltransf-25 domain-containing protein n=1 Tax=Mycena sanguinolenta TaxID=230812 RepID=A0A8H6Y9D3_9AGAR|nr:Methyltransf-25 domain-containing protein [Mycena sanguinolenta]